MKCCALKLCGDQNHYQKDRYLSVFDYDTSMCVS